MLSFVFPIDGDVLNQNDGVPENGSLLLSVRLCSDKGAPTVNGVNATLDPATGDYKASVRLDSRRNTLCAKAGDEEEEIVVLYLRDGVGHFQFFIDDNIWFLRDIAEHDYRSIYENPYLAFFKSMYDRYGALTHMHVYYETDRFNLSMMPDKYKSEWKEAASWLRLTFHARGDKPDYPHKNATYEDTLRDFDLVTNEIRRFAGEELLSPATVPHWNEMSPEASRAFRDRGIRIIPGLVLSERYASRGLDEHTRTRCFWYDREEDVISGYNSICLNKNKLEDIVPALEALSNNPQKSGFLYLMIHEQYFYPGFEDYVPHYVSYLPDFRERVETAIRWAVENGYTSKWMEDVLLEE